LAPLQREKVKIVKALSAQRILVLI